MKPTESAAEESAFSRLKKLLHHPELWRAGQLAAEADTLPSGFAILDEHLPGHGWPRAGLAELLLETSGVGELRLLAPLMRELSRTEQRWVAWVNPPFLPYAPALETLGIDTSRILLIHPKDHHEALWAMERASRSGTCSMTLGWLDERRLQLKDTRRLQLAAREGRTLACLFRPSQAAAANSMAELRLQVMPDEPGYIALNIHKRRGGWPVSGLQLQVEEQRRPQEIREQLSLWRQQRQQQDERPAAPEVGGAAREHRRNHDVGRLGNKPDTGRLGNKPDAVDVAADAGSRITH